MKQLFTIIGYALSLTTACGVFIHDARIDRAATTSMEKTTATRLPRAVVKTDAGVSADLHTHPDRANRGLLKGFSYQSPSIPPREQKSKQYFLQKYAPRGHHAFDNYNLPIVS